MYIYILLFIRIYAYLHLYIFSYILNSCIENFYFCKYTYLQLFTVIYRYTFIYINIFFLNFCYMTFFLSFIKVYINVYKCKKMNINFKNCVVYSVQIKNI